MIQTQDNKYSEARYADHVTAYAEILAKQAQANIAFLAAKTLVDSLNAQSAALEEYIREYHQFQIRNRRDV